MQEQSIGPVENLVRCNGPRRRNVPLASAPLALARYSTNISHSKVENKIEFGIALM